MYLLALHPDEQEQVAAEVAPLGLTPNNAAEMLPRLVHTRAVIDEVLRLYPPAFVIVRQAIDDDDNVGGVRIAKGSLVLIAPWVLHRHRRFWIAPDRFDLRVARGVAEHHPRGVGVGLDIGEPRVERARYALLLRLVAGQVVVPDLAQLGVVALEEAAVERLLRLEVVVDDRGRDARAAGDLVDRGAVVATLGEHLGGGLLDHLAAGLCGQSFPRGHRVLT